MEVTRQAFSRYVLSVWRNSVAHSILHSKLFLSWICFFILYVGSYYNHITSWISLLMQLSCLLTITSYYWILPWSRHYRKDGSLNPGNNPRRFCYYAHFFFITKLVACRVLGFDPASDFSVCILASRLTGSFVNTVWRLFLSWNAGFNVVFYRPHWAQGFAHVNVCTKGKKELRSWFLQHTVIEGKEELSACLEAYILKLERRVKKCDRCQRVCKFLRIP